MKTAIIERLEALGASHDVQGNSLRDDLVSIDIPFRVFDFETIAGGSHLDYDIADFLEENGQMLEEPVSTFYDRLFEQFHTRDFNSKVAPGSGWRIAGTFTTFGAGRPVDDKDPEKRPFVEDPKEDEVSAMKELLGSDNLDFVWLGCCQNAYPNFQLVWLGSSDCENPQMFGMDHETGFELSSRGTLETFLQEFATRSEFTNLMKERVAALKEKVEEADRQKTSFFSRWFGK